MADHVLIFALRDVMILFALTYLPCEAQAILQEGVALNYIATSIRHLDCIS